LSRVGASIDRVMMQTMGSLTVMRTTVNIDEHLLAEAKAEAARTKRSLGDVVDDALWVLLL
jgi:Arc/MetJ family transcription regulator